jgi:hypothetical protein
VHKSAEPLEDDELCSMMSTIQLYASVSEQVGTGHKRSRDPDSMRSNEALKLVLTLQVVLCAEAARLTLAARRALQISAVDGELDEEM